MHLTSTTDGNTLVIHAMDDRIDAAGALLFKEKMRETVEAFRDMRVILDLSRVHFLDSSGLGAVVAVLKIMAPDRKLELAGLTPTVEKVFRLTRMDTVFTIHKALDQGLRHAG